jgi:hypothetical protein
MTIIKQRRRMLLSLALKIILAPALVGLIVWSGLLVWLSGPENELVRVIWAALQLCTGLAALVSLWTPRWRLRSFAAFTITLMAVAAWWSNITPSNQRQWQADVAVLPSATISDNLVTLHKVRNFNYRSETDYTPAYYDRTVDLNKLEGIDLIASYWMGPHIAHVFVSFTFTDGPPVAISIETRKEQHETYSTLKGFFRQYELYYVVADERDLIRLRTNYRQDPPEEVYVYRLKSEPEGTKRLFMEYLANINALVESPQFYNTLTTNCTTTIWLHSRVNQNRVPLAWQLIASGHVPEYLFENRRLAATDLRFEDIRQRAQVNARARAADQDKDFSRRIRMPAH